jgi:hypothetical protein
VRSEAPLSSITVVRGHASNLTRLSPRYRGGTWTAHWSLMLYARSSASSTGPVPVVAEASHNHPGRSVNTQACSLSVSLMVSHAGALMKPDAQGARCTLYRWMVRWSCPRGSSLRGRHGMHGSPGAPGWRRAGVRVLRRQIYANQVCRREWSCSKAMPSPCCTTA